MSSLTIIVAIDQHAGIGIRNTLPWRLPEDMAHFKRTTSGHTVIMGRKTYESIGKPLPDRRNIVITRNPAWQADGVEVAHSLSAAQELVAGQTAFIIGGAEIYQQALPLADRLLLTRIEQSFDCDAFFPEISAENWRQTEVEQHFSERSQLHFAFVTYIKNRSQHVSR
jgi:dihydrofolate reductase